MLGTHWIGRGLHCNTCNWSLSLVESTLNTLAAELSLTAVASPQTYNHGDRSFAGVLLIAESHISLHAFPDQRSVHVDVFSCADFDPTHARTIATRMLSVGVWDETVVGRGTPHDGHDLV